MCYTALEARINKLTTHKIYWQWSLGQHYDYYVQNHFESTHTNFNKNMVFYHQFLVTRFIVHIPRGLKVHDFKITNLIDHIAKKTIQMELNSISPKWIKIISCLSIKTKWIWRWVSPQQTYSKVPKQTKPKWHASLVLHGL